MSKKNRLNNKDMMKWSKNVLVFSVPMLTILASAVQGSITWEMAEGAMLLYLINCLIDLGKKFKEET